ncbi:MAG: AIR synthase-related protein [Dehalococcoidia bacterium]|nr:AIR synthase-related protein [Dehalococcoidia bacterium]
MGELPAIGNISPEVFRELIFPHLGAKDESIVIGPQHGTNISIAKIAGQAVSFTTSPVFIVPECGWERAAWLALHMLISDSVTCGLLPRYLSLNLNLPAETTEEQLTIIWETIHRECEKLGIALVAERIGRYENCHYPLVGGATAVGIGAPDSYVSPKFIQPGDKIIIAKGPAIATAGILGTMAPIHTEQALGKDIARKASDIFYKTSIITEASVAMSAGVRDDGVSAINNASERGIWGGLYEMAEAADMGVRVDQEKIVIEPGVAEICHLYGIDPYTSISKGALIIACRPHKADEVAHLIQKQGIKASIAGEFTAKEQGMVLIIGGNLRSLMPPVADPFWQAFYRSLKLSKKD